MTKQHSPQDQKALRTTIITALKTKVIKHPRLMESVEAMESIHAMSGISEAGMLLLGPSGVGKTTAIEQYCKRFMAAYGETETDTVSLRPIVHLTIPANATLKQMLNALLSSMDSAGKSGSAEQLAQHVSRAFELQGVELLILDECQHLLKEQAQTNTRNVLNQIKILMDKHKLAVVMSGITDAKKVIAQYDELYQRFLYAQIELHPFSVGSPEERQLFAAYLNTYARIMEEFGIRTIQLDSIIMLERIELATRGVPRLIFHLFMKVLLVADLNRTLSLNDFEQALARDQLNPELGLFNPFSASPAKVTAQREALQAKRAKHTSGTRGYRQ